MATGDITQSVISSHEFDDDKGLCPDIIHISGDVYAITYQGTSSHGVLKTVEIGTNGIISGSIASYEFDAAYGIYPDITHVSGDVYAIAYVNGSNNGVVTSVKIETDGTISGSVSSYTFETTMNWQKPNIVPASGDYYAIAYAGPDNDGWVKTVEIDSSGNITQSVISSYEFDTDCVWPNIIHISGNVYAIVYGSTAGDGWCKTVTIASDGTITQSTISSYEFDTVNCSYFNIVHVADAVYALCYYGPDADGWCKTVTIASDGTITQSTISSYEFDTTLLGMVDFIHVSGNYYATAFAGADSDGWLKTLEIETPSGPVTETETITSDALINVPETQTINSDALIYVPETETINSDAHIWVLGSETITSDAHVEVTKTQTITSNTNITKETINSDANITKETITSDAHVFKVDTEIITSDACVWWFDVRAIYSNTNITKESINSDAYITKETITSDATISQTGSGSINSDAQITKETITSDAHIYQPLLSGSINSDAYITKETITSDAYVYGSGSFPTQVRGGVILGQGTPISASRPAIVIGVTYQSEETTVPDIISAVVDLSTIQTPQVYTDYVWAYDWVTRQWNGCIAKFEARQSDDEIELTGEEWQEIQKGELISDVKKYHQWRAHVWASGSRDFELHQFTLKAYVNYSANAFYSSII